MKPIYLSKKFWSTVIAALIPVANRICGIGLDAGELSVAVVPLLIYVLGLFYKERG